MMETSITQLRLHLEMSLIQYGITPLVFSSRIQKKIFYLKLCQRASKGVKLLLSHRYLYMSFATWRQQWGTCFLWAKEELRLVKSTLKESFHQISSLVNLILREGQDLTIDTIKCHQEADTTATHQQNKQGMFNKTTIHSSNSIQLHLHHKDQEIINNFTRVISKCHNNHMVLTLDTLKEALVIKPLNSGLIQTTVLWRTFTSFKLKWAPTSCLPITNIHSLCPKVTISNLQVCHHSITTMGRCQWCHRFLKFHNITWGVIPNSIQLIIMMHNGSKKE